MKLFRIFSFLLGITTVSLSAIVTVAYSYRWIIGLFDQPVRALIAMVIMVAFTLPGFFHIGVSRDGLRKKASRGLLGELIMGGGGFLIILFFGRFLLWEAVTNPKMDLFWWWYLAVSTSISFVGVTMMVASETDRSVFP